MGKSSPSPPPPPDPVKTAQAQAAANREAAIAGQEMSMVNQLTPFGSLTYEQTGTSAEGNPLYTATQELSPDQQRLLDYQTQIGQQFGETAQQQLGQVSSMLEAPLDYGSLGAAPTLNEQTRQRTQEAILSRLDPQFQRDRQRLETSLANQGFMTGTEGYNEAMDEYNRRMNDAYLAADLQSGQEMARMYGLESTQRDRAIGEMLQQRQVPLNELAAMMSGSQVQGPQFVNTPAANVAPSDIMGATYGSANLQNQAYGQQMNAVNSSRQGLAGLAGTALTAAAFAF